MVPKIRYYAELNCYYAGRGLFFNFADTDAPIRISAIW
jgi:hypothetical protein